MDIYELIEARYSVRSFQGEVSPEQLERILNAGRLAPSARNRQAWKFVVVQRAETRLQLAQAAEQPFLGPAPVIIAVVSTDPTDQMHCGVESAPVDCALAMDHMMLAAVAEGLGSCWIGHFDQAAVKQILEVPSSCKVIGLLPMGRPASRPPKKMRKALESVVCQERYS